ncbi:hypothetical protein C8039_03025 [Halogeometricum sp. wsp3]|nr:hypothetical protein C8039_03025 [Halogeometricum sp. wsp3]
MSSSSEAPVSDDDSSDQESGDSDTESVTEERTPTVERGNTIASHPSLRGRVWDGMSYRRRTATTAAVLKQWDGQTFKLPPHRVNAVQRIRKESVTSIARSMYSG